MLMKKLIIFTFLFASVQFFSPAQDNRQKKGKMKLEVAGKKLPKGKEEKKEEKKDKKGAESKTK